MKKDKKDKKDKRQRNGMKRRKEKRRGFGIREGKNSSVMSYGKQNRMD